MRAFSTGRVSALFFLVFACFVVGTGQALAFGGGGYGGGYKSDDYRGMNDAGGVGQGSVSDVNLGEGQWLLQEDDDKYKWRRHVISPRVACGAFMQWTGMTREFDGFTYVQCGKQVKDLWKPLYNSPRASCGGFREWNGDFQELAGSTYLKCVKGANYVWRVMRDSPETACGYFKEWTGVIKKLNGRIYAQCS